MRNFIAAIAASGVCPPRCPPADSTCPVPDCIDPEQLLALDLAAEVNAQPAGGNTGIVPPMPVPSTEPTALTCKPVIPPWKGHHGGVDACFDGKGRVQAFRERPEVVDPFG